MTTPLSPDQREELRRRIEAATPGPWVAQSRDDGASDPWWIDTHAYAEGPEPVWAPSYPISTADAALIVAAVNAYDRLRAIEAAAREYMDAEWGPSERYQQAKVNLYALLSSEVPSDAR